MADTGVLFEPGLHRYTRHNQDYVSVTTMLDDMGCTGPDKKWYKQEHRDRGSRVHSLSASIARFEHPDSEYEWDETCDHPAILPYGRAVQRWVREVGFVVHYSETPVWCDDMRVAGTPDLIGRMTRRGNKMALVDVKTGRVPPSVGLQTAPYRVMAEKVHGIKIDARYSLLLTASKPDGDYRFRELQDPMDFGNFLHFLGAWNWLKQHNKLVQEAA